MTCPHGASPRTKEQRKITALGYRTFCCSGCRRTFNEAITALLYISGADSEGSTPVL